jgi:methyl-accepting chemotaxis protein
MSAWTVGKKITVGFLMILVLALSVELFGLWITNRTSIKLSLVSAEYLPETELATQIEREVLNARIYFIYFVTIQKDGALEKGWERFRKAQQELPKLQALVDSSETFAGIRPDVQQLRRDFNSYQPVLERIIDVVQKNQNHGPEFADLVKEWARLGGAMVDSAGRLSRLGSRVTGDSAKSAAAQLHNTATTLAGACVAGLLIGVALTFFVTRDINRALRKVLQDLGGAAHQVMTGASQISASAQSLAQGASEQAATLQETSAAGEQINAMASQNAENSKSAADNVAEASKRIGEANRNLEQMAVSMDEINASSDAISKIIRVIDEIAFQTNILALNAAVEAARAGEAGLGFAVVADEVRNLAQRCAQAAKDTAGMIEESISKSNDGKTKLDRVAKAVRSITESAGKAKTLVDEVKLGNEEQARGIEQIAKGITQMEQVTQSTAAQAEESAAASSELSTQAQAIGLVVLRIRALVTSHNDYQHT